MPKEDKCIYSNRIFEQNGLEIGYYYKIMKENKDNYVVEIDENEYKEFPKDLFLSYYE